jgi:uncharacterized membrane protein
MIAGLVPVVPVLVVGRMLAVAFLNFVLIVYDVIDGYRGWRVARKYR